MDKITLKRNKEKLLVSKMIMIYCKGKHKTKGILCKECKQLNDYAMQRIEKCPFMENKTSCSCCKIYCYKPQMQEKIKKVMRFSGIRIIFHNPIMAISHIIQTIKQKKRLEKNHEN